MRKSWVFGILATTLLAACFQAEKRLTENTSLSIASFPGDLGIVHFRAQRDGSIQGLTIVTLQKQDDGSYDVKESDKTSVRLYGIPLDEDYFILEAKSGESYFYDFVTFSDGKVYRPEFDYEDMFPKLKVYNDDVRKITSNALIPIPGVSMTPASLLVSKEADLLGSFLLWKNQEKPTVKFFAFYYDLTTKDGQSEFEFGATAARARATD